MQMLDGRGEGGGGGAPAASSGAAAGNQPAQPAPQDGPSDDFDDDIPF